MSKLNFDITVNNSDFIEKLEQIRSAVRITAKEMEKQAQKVSLSFQQMADNVTLTTSTVGNAIKSMHKQINDAIKSLSKLDSSKSPLIYATQASERRDYPLDCVNRIQV